MGWVLEDDLHVSVILGVEVKLPRDFHSFGRHGSQVLSFAQFIMDHGDVMLRERERERERGANDLPVVPAHTVQNTSRSLDNQPR